MNKKNLIYVSLISLILILGIYYITIPNNMLENVEPTISESIDNTSTEEISSLVGLRVENEEMVIAKLEDLQNTITDTSKSSEEKNIAYEQLKNLNQLKGKQEEIEKLIKKEFNFDSFVKINEDQINIVISNNNHNKELANNIIKKVQSMFKEKKYITIKFN
ncbi:MAG: SpoIIIAH-like family protein [Firmicutes bacterium]|nr:SpoIIIAH-like family protein [Bacillota bacterium]